MNPIRRFMRLFYYLLYHPFAFAYDLVAWTVSFGRWKDWVFSVVPFIEGNLILELGHGPGHLQRLLLDRGLVAVALDESTQMGRLAKRRLGPSQKLTRGLSQSLPYTSETFDCIVSTFPSEYIFAPQTLAEAKRTLRKDGRFIVLPGALPRNQFLKWLYKVTGESPEAITDALIERFKQPFVQTGFQVEIHILETEASQLAMLIATK